jgi:sulfate transport system ATP-binding protein
VSRILSFGVTARVELDGLNGALGQHFEVEATRERIAHLALREGQSVRLVPSRLRVFENGPKSAVQGKPL